MTIKRITSLFLTLIMLLSFTAPLSQTAFAASDMRLSENGITYIKNMEGFSSKPYQDNNQWSVGYGTACPADKLDEYKEKGISKEEAEVLFSEYITIFENSVNSFITKNNLTLNQYQFDMLVSFSFNVGTAWMSNSLLKQRILAGDTSSSFIQELITWCTVKGEIQPHLVDRRVREANLWLTGDYTTKNPSNIAYVYYSPNGGNVPCRLQGYLVTETPPPLWDATHATSSFLGWYTSTSGGTKIERLTGDLKGKTLYARWSADESGSLEVLPTPTPPSMEPVTVTVIGDDVNLREGNGTNFSCVGQANKGDILTITAVAEGSGLTWGKSERGWICLSYTNYNDVISGDAITTPPPTTTPEPIVTPVPTPIPTPVPTPKPPEHVHNYSTIITEPTCISDGQISYTCSCGQSYSEPKASLGHNWSKWTTIAIPTSTSEGSQKRVCSRCNGEEIRKLKKLTEEIVATGTVKVGDCLRIRKDPRSNSAEVGRLDNGTWVAIFECRNDWGRIDSGWISLKYVVKETGSFEDTVIPTPSPTPLPVITPNPSPSPIISPSPIPVPTVSPDISANSLMNSEDSPIISPDSEDRLLFSAADDSPAESSDIFEESDEDAEDGLWMKLVWLLAELVERFFEFLMNEGN